MADEASTAGPLGRLGNLIDLVTTLDVRVGAALDGIEDMRARMASIDGVSTSAESLVEELRSRLAGLDSRLNSDLDEIKAALLARLGELDSFPARLDRLELALVNIERATVNLDHQMTGVVEALPDFITKRMAPQPEP